MALAGCSDQPAEYTVAVIYWTSPLIGEGRVEQVEYRQGDDEPDPEGTATGGYTALLGEGCPKYIEL